MKPLVLHFRASNFFGGPEKQILGHAHASQKYRHTVLTFIERGSSNEFRDRCLAEGIPVEVVRTGHPFSPVVLHRVRSVFRYLAPLAVCTHGYKPAILTLLARAGLQVTFIAFARGHTHETPGVRRLELIERKTYRYADRVVAVSTGYAALLKNSGISAGHITVVPNAIDLPRVSLDPQLLAAMRLQFGCRPGQTLIATVGRLSPEKDQASLIRAFAGLRQGGRSARLLIVGDGPARAVLEEAARSIDVEGIEFLGFRRDVEEILSAIDLFVLPSLTEGLPNALLEAMSHARPIVATSVGGVPDVVRHGVEGLLVPPARPDLLAEAMNRCLDNPDGAAVMGRNARERVRLEFSFERQAHALEQLYSELSLSRSRSLPRSNSEMESESSLETHLPSRSQSTSQVPIHPDQPPRNRVH